MNPTLAVIIKKPDQHCFTNYSEHRFHKAFLRNKSNAAVNSRQYVSYATGCCCQHARDFFDEYRFTQIITTINERNNPYLLQRKPEASFSLVSPVSINYFLHSLIVLTALVSVLRFPLPTNCKKWKVSLCLWRDSQNVSYLQKKVLVNIAHTTLYHFQTARKTCFQTRKEEKKRRLPNLFKIQNWISFRECQSLDASLKCFSLKMFAESCVSSECGKSGPGYLHLSW